MFRPAEGRGSRAASHRGHGAALAALASFLSVFVPSAFAAEALFDTWIGYDTGTYAVGRFPWGVAEGDLDGDGDRDLVVGSWPWTSGFCVLMNQGDGAFERPVRYASTLPPLDIVMADFDGDGRRDVVVSNTGYNYEGTTVSLYRNLGGGVLGPAQSFTAGAGPVGLSVADYDGDTRLDLAVALYGTFGNGSTVAILRNNGAGGFFAPVTYAAGSAPYKLSAGDFTGDAVPDVAVALEDHEVSILRNLGAGTFAAPISLPTTLVGPNFYPCVAVGDVDGDGDQDVLYSSTHTRWPADYGAFALFRNLGGGSFAAAELVSFDVRFTAGAVALALGDVDGDDWPDVAGAHFDNTAAGGFFIARGDGEGGFLPGTLYPAGQTPNGVLIMPADGDAEADVVVLSNSSLEATVHRNPGDGSFDVPPTYSLDSGVVKLHADAADLDEDGDLDLAVSYSYLVSGGNVAVMWNAGDGSFASRTLLGAPHQALAVKCRDIDGDGRKDLLWIDDWDYDGKWRRNLGGGAFAAAVNTIALPNCGPGDIDGIDLDNDGDIDVVATEEGACFPGEARYIDIALNRGDGTFDPGYRVDLEELVPREVTSGDFNQDGNVDLAVGMMGAYGFNNKVTVLLGLGNGLFFPPVHYTVGNGPEGIVAVDLTGDGILDLATNNTGTDGPGEETMSVLRGRGDGSFFDAVTYPGSYSPDLLGNTAIVAGDPDADGDKDLMVANYGSHDVSYYENSGGGAFLPQVRYGVNTGPFDLLYEDFTGDGVGDLAVTVGLPPSGAFGAVAIVSGIEATTTSVSNGSGLGLVDSPARGSLVAHPNPFRRATVIRYELPGPAPFELSIYDARGRLVRTLAEGLAPGGSHAAPWDGRDAAGLRVGPGVFFARLRSGEEIRSGRILVIR